VVLQCGIMRGFVLGSLGNFWCCYVLGSLKYKKKENFLKRKILRIYITFSICTICLEFWDKYH
jgi:hypothetical protein